MTTDKLQWRGVVGPDEAQRASETLYRLLTEGWARAVWETDAAGIVTDDSPSWRAYTGQTVDEWLGLGWLDAIHPDERAYAERQWREAVAASGLVNAEFRLRAPDGGWRWTNVRAAPILDAAGRIQKWVGINIDIDERKRAEAALRESEERYRSLFQRMGQGYCELELLRDETGRAVDQRYIAFNPAFERLFGIPVASATGRTASEMFPGLEPWWHDAFDRIARDGKPERIEHAVASLGRWFEVYVYPTSADRLIVLYEEVTQRHQAEVVLRESEEHQAFLLKLSDALRAEPDADAVANRALKMLLDRLGLDQCYITYYRPTEDEAVFPYQLGNDTVPPLPAKVRLSDFPEAFEQVLDRTFVIEDDYERRGLSEAERANSTALGMRAMLASTIRRGERRPLASMVAVASRQRRWTSAEIALVEEAAERTWVAIERARAEAALRESEERFRQFAHAAAEGAWIRDAQTLDMEYVSPAASRIYGVELQALFGGVQHWAGLILPEDRDVALARLEEARRGEAVVHEFRIKRPSDGDVRWIRSTDFPLFNGQGGVQRIGGLAEDVTEAKLAIEHQGVLLAELQHRVRNIMALLRSITSRTGDRAEGVAEYRDLMMGRLLAFARVQALLTRTANVSVGIASIVHDEVSVQAEHESQYVLDGPDVVLSPKAAEVLTLAIHELATNAVKYGALSVPTGRVTVRWSTFEKCSRPWLAFDWTEEGAPTPPQPAPNVPRRRGFGSEMIEARIPYELQGCGQVSIEPGGAHCHLEFPLQEGASILETGAPQRAIVFGGEIEMTGGPDLTGRRVLVVEDDYYLAADTARALRGAGAEVLGPCATEEDARAELDEQRPDAVVVDINLGTGPSFKLAESLKDGDIPFVFTTGYDAGVIPAEFEGVERLEKPLQLRQIIGVVAKLTAAV